jgi:archaellum biogenesis ATPase FlaH
VKPKPPPLPYTLDDETERALAYAVSRSPQFYAKIGHAIDVDRLRSSIVKDVVTAAHALASRNSGHGVGWTGAVVQHLTTQMGAGKITLERVQDARELLMDAAVDLGDFDYDALALVVTPIVKGVRYKEVVQGAIAGLKEGVDPHEFAVEFERVSKLGTVAPVERLQLVDVIDTIDLSKPEGRDLLTTGIPDLDRALDGGLQRSTLMLFAGETGAGKSLALAHLCVDAVLAGRRAIYVTLEMSAEQVLRRMIRNLTDMTSRECDADPTEARRRTKAALASIKNRLSVTYMHPLVTSPRDIAKEVHETEQLWGEGCDVLVVDFIDKLVDNPKASRYDDMLACTDGIRNIMVERTGWSATATQTNRQGIGKGWVGLNAIADSMNKVRSADLVIGIGRTEDDQQAEEVRFTVSKRRDGEGAHAQVGPVAWDPEHGRICIVDRPAHW